MSKSVLISIQPKWCELIASGKKTIEVRKNRPKLETPFKCYIYCTNNRPFLVWGDVFRGNWETEFTRLYGYGRKKAEEIWDVFNGRIMGEFMCDTIVKDNTFGHDEAFNGAACLSEDEASEYAFGSPVYGWHISDLEVYDTPKELMGFNALRKTKFGMEPVRLTRAPQSWCYVEETRMD